ncbi:MAG: family 43 glycosylhydrolase [Blautia sp.]|nr:family 43 glycosylhydrolase [Blautia sp.]
MRHYCNPLNLKYRYQFMKKQDAENTYSVFREAADPSLILFHGKYYLFPSMCAGFYTSDDLYEWEFHEFLQDMPIYDYAPDVRAIGEYLYFCASKSGENCSFYRTKDPVKEPFEEIKGTFPFWDPNLFCDDDGRFYFYWGCSNTEPIYGVELDPETMEKIGEPVPLIAEHEAEYGYERAGDDHKPPKTEEEIRAAVEGMFQNLMASGQITGIPEDVLKESLYKTMGNKPYIEGAWMNKYQGKYYLQYAAAGAEFNVYNDGVYVGESPLGPFHLAKNNPYSYKPGGFMNGAGHGSTLEDKEGHYWHTATMRISRTYTMERRVGLWKAGFDEDGELYCDQRFGDWPISMDAEPFAKPDWMLLSYGKPVTVSSGTGAECITDEDVRTWWTADGKEEEWAEVDLKAVCDVRGIQVNFADNLLEMEKPEDLHINVLAHESRGIDCKEQYTRWKLEGSEDGENYFPIEDKWDAATDYAHDYISMEEGIQVRYLRLTVRELPYQAAPSVSGIRVFGKGNGEIPQEASDVQIDRITDLDMEVSWKADGAVGHNVLWGYAPDKLYHSCMVYGKDRVKIGALVKGQPLYVRVDSFNENGVQEGSPTAVK